MHKQSQIFKHLMHFFNTLPNTYKYTNIHTNIHTNIQIYIQIYNYTIIIVCIILYVLYICITFSRRRISLCFSWMSATACFTFECTGPRICSESTSFAASGSFASCSISSSVASFFTMEWLGWVGLGVEFWGFFLYRF